MDDNIVKLYYLWLETACRFEPELVDMCYSGQIYTDKAWESEVSGGERDIKRVYENRASLQKKADLSQYKGRINLNISLSEAENILNYCIKNDIQIITISSKSYPDRLRNIYCPPKLLFVKGDISGTDAALGISVVGTRSATPSGISNAERIAFELSERGVIITSGMALGIDSAAHRGAISGGGRTFAVLAGGVDVVYPAVNRDIYELIRETGAIISERPPGCVGQPRFYKQRNRILIGLSQGVLFVEGEEDSGTSMSARLALENNRDIFAVPSDINIVQSQLPNRLISEGAVLVRSAADILGQYAYMYPSADANYKVDSSSKNIIKGAFERLKNIKAVKRQSKQGSKSDKSDAAASKAAHMKKSSGYSEDVLADFYESERFKSLSESNKKIIEYIGLSGDNGVIADDITESTGIKSTELGSMLMMLQINGLIRQQGGGRLFLKL